MTTAPNILVLQSKPFMYDKSVFKLLQYADRDRLMSFLSDKQCRGEKIILKKDITLEDLFYLFMYDTVLT